MERYGKSFLVKFALVIVVLTVFATLTVTLLFYGAVSLSKEDNKIEQIYNIEHVIQQYSLNDCDRDDMFDGAYYGMVEAIEDPYSSFLSASDMRKIEEQTSGEFFGIGVEMIKPNDSSYPIIQAVFEGAPAYKVGIQPKDLLLEVNGKSVANQTLDETLSALKNGPKREEILLKLQRGEDLYQVKVKKEKVHTVTVHGKMLTDTIGYLSIRQFNTHTYDEFVEKLEEILESGAQKLVIDLRSNPGGTVESAEKIADLFLDEATIYYTKNKQGEKRYAYARDGKQDLPILLLTDSATASAAELLAAALRDNDRALIIGTQTFGKGIMQEFFSVGVDAAVKLTTQEYYTPRDEKVQGVGLSPDILVEQSPEIAFFSPEEDEQLKCAIEEFSK